MSRAPRRAVMVALGLALAMALPAAVSADHGWGPPYHWAREANPFTLKLGDNVTSAWDSYLGTTSVDWSQSDVLDTAIVAGSANPKTCKATTGRVQVCSARYGNNGWLGIAGIYITRGEHITKAYVKVNDTYFNTPTYNTPAWRNMVMCQEVGHTFGLGHQDENFNNPNLDTCMDYTSNPGSNQHPNQGDYDQLLCIYDPETNGDTLTTATHTCTGTGHLDSTTTVGSAPAAAAAAPNAHAADAAWGTLLKVTNHGHGAWYVRDFGGGNMVLTHVLWADR